MSALDFATFSSAMKCASDQEPVDCFEIDGFTVKVRCTPSVTSAMLYVFLSVSRPGLDRVWAEHTRMPLAFACISETREALICDAAKKLIDAAKRELADARELEILERSIAGRVEQLGEQRVVVPAVGQTWREKVSRLVVSIEHRIAFGDGNAGWRLRYKDQSITEVRDTFLAEHYEPVQQGAAQPSAKDATVSEMLAGAMDVREPHTIILSPSQWEDLQADLAERESNATCLRCGGPAFTLLTSTDCKRAGGCRTAEERVDAMMADTGRFIALWHIGDHEPYWTAGGYQDSEKHPTREGAIALWREKTLATERSR